MAKLAFIGLGVMGFPMAGHLAAKGGHQITVYNRTRAKADAWMDWACATLQPAIGGLFWAFYRTPAARHDAARIAQLSADCAGAIGALDRWLGERPFLTGEAFSMAGTSP